MSHFSRIKTRIVDKELLLLALKDMGLEPESGEDIQARGFASNRTPVEVRVRPSTFGYDIGFRKTGETYDIVADWFGVRGVKQADFIDQLNQRYAYHATRVRLEEQGFTLVGEEVQADGKIHLVLRRMG